MGVSQERSGSRRRFVPLPCSCSLTTGKTDLIDISYEVSPLAILRCWPFERKRSLAIAPHFSHTCTHNAFAISKEGSCTRQGSRTRLARGNRQMARPSRFCVFLVGIRACVAAGAEPGSGGAGRRVLSTRQKPGSKKARHCYNSDYPVTTWSYK